MNFEEAERQFINRCLALGLSTETIKQYQKVLKRLIQNYTKDKTEKTIESTDIRVFTSTLLREHLAFLSRCVSPTTVKIHYMALHSFFSFLYKNDIISEDVMRNIEKPKVPKRDLQAFTKEHLDILLSVFDRSTFTGFRNYVIACVLFSTGVRRGELVKIKLTDIMFEINAIKIIGKGNKLRNVPVSDTLRKLLIKYIKNREEHIKTNKLYRSPYCFISYTGNKLSENAVTDIFRKVGKENRMNGVRVSPHTFRHSFAKYFLLNGGDVFTLQKILGHSDISVTRQYVNLNENDIRVQNEKYNPLENETWKYY